MILDFFSRKHIYKIKIWDIFVKKKNVEITIFVVNCWSGLRTFRLVIFLEYSCNHVSSWQQLWCSLFVHWLISHFCEGKIESLNEFSHRNYAIWYALETCWWTYALQLFPLHVFTISYDYWIDSRHMFPERTQLLLPLELKLFLSAFLFYIYIYIIIICLKKMFFNSEWKGLLWTLGVGKLFMIFLF